VYHFFLLALVIKNELTKIGKEMVYYLRDTRFIFASRLEKDTAF
jgi:hypothetical protein